MFESEKGPETKLSEMVQESTGNTRIPSGTPKNLFIYQNNLLLCYEVIIVFIRILLFIVPITPIVPG